WARFLTALGVGRYLRVVAHEEEGDPWVFTKAPARWKLYLDTLERVGYSRNLADVAYLPALERRITRRKALALAEMMASGWANYYARFASSTYDYFYRKQRTNEVHSYLMWQLRNTDWLPTS